MRCSCCCLLLLILFVFTLHTHFFLNKGPMKQTIKLVCLTDLEKLRPYILAKLKTYLIDLEMFSVNALAGKYVAFTSIDVIF